MKVLTIPTEVQTVDIYYLDFMYFLLIPGVCIGVWAEGAAPLVGQKLIFWASLKHDESKCLAYLQA